MVTNSWWIKMDYWVQTVLGCCILVAAATFIGLYLALSLLIPLGAWQVLSGLVYAIKGERLQQIYIGVVSIYFGVWYVSWWLESFEVSIAFMLIALPIGAWKYTVVRADYICLGIIDTPKIEANTLLDA
jgi:hypothetical protein